MSEQKNKSFIYWILTAVIASFIFVLGFFLFEKIFIEQSQDYLIAGYSAFFGAFFAFILIRIAEILKEMWKRQEKANNELVILDRLMNINYGILDSNIIIVDDFIKVLQKIESEDSVYVNPIHKLAVRKESSLNLANIHYLNKIFSLMVDFERSNNDVDTINGWNKELRTALIQRNISREEYRVNAKKILEDLPSLKKYFLHLSEEIISAMAENRILMRKQETFYHQLLVCYLGFNQVGVSGKEIETEKEIIKEEIQQVKKESKEKVDKIFGNET